MEAGHIVSLPQEPTEIDSSVVKPVVQVEAGGSAVVPQEPRGTSPST